MFALIRELPGLYAAATSNIYAAATGNLSAAANGNIHAAIGAVKHAASGISLNGSLTCGRVGQTAAGGVTRERKVRAP